MILGDNFPIGDVSVERGESPLGGAGGHNTLAPPSHFNNLTNTLRDAAPPITCDEIWTRYYDDLMGLLRYSIYNGVLWMVHPDEVTDYLHDFYLIMQRQPSILQRWCDTYHAYVNLSSYLLRTMEWSRWPIFKRWRQQTAREQGVDIKTCTYEPGHYRLDGGSDSTANPLCSWSTFDGSDSTSWQFDWPVLNQEYRAMMPDDRYRDIYDCLVSDGVAKDVAKEHDTAPSNICVIADEVRNLCAGQGWKYYEPTPGRRKTGYVEMATHRNAVGKALVCESYRHLPGRPKK